MQCKNKYTVALKVALKERWIVWCVYYKNVTPCI